MYIRIRKNLRRKDKIFNVLISDTFLNSSHIYFLHQTWINRGSKSLLQYTKMTTSGTEDQGHLGSLCHNPGKTGGRLLLCFRITQGSIKSTNPRPIQTN